MRETKTFPVNLGIFVTLQPEISKLPVVVQK